MLKKNKQYIFLGVVLIVLLISMFVSLIPLYRIQNTMHDEKFIYCIMITGKDECRKHFANVAIENFNRQDYPYKKLIIINHGQYTVLDRIYHDIFEFHVDKTKEMTLGDLRNIGLEMVPKNALWITWDDNDWRHDNFLSILYNQLIESRKHCITFSNRIEYNTNTQFVWLMHLKERFFIMLVPKDSRFMYLSKDTGEDLDFIDFYKKHYSIKVLHDNNPNLYIRLVHVNNTSKYVNTEKKKIVNKDKFSNYTESDSTPEQERYTHNIINTFYKNVPCIER